MKRDYWSALFKEWRWIDEETGQGGAIMEFMGRVTELNDRQPKLTEQGIQASGIWYGTIVFRCAWAHPVWADYLLTIYDLDKPTIDGKAAMKRDAAATHEFMVWALQPRDPGTALSAVDFAKPIQEQREPLRRVLEPANHGYQFKAESNEAAWARVNELVDRCLFGTLSPDTDQRSYWDRLMADGWTLLEEVRLA